MTERVAEVLVVEDDPTTAEIVRQVFDSNGFNVKHVVDGEAALELCKADNLDIVILDFELPGISGQETCRRIREFSDVYIVMLTSRTEDLDKILTISLGADDYLTKPFSPQELIVRARALLRRPRNPNAVDVREPGEPPAIIEIDDDHMEVTVDGNSIGATQIEYKLARCLYEAAPEALSRNDLLVQVWDDTSGGSTHMVDVHLSNLRKKLRDTGADPRCIQNVRNVGFRLVRKTSA